VPPTDESPHRPGRKERGKNDDDGNGNPFQGDGEILSS
jgi:hypothetical protein